MIKIRNLQPEDIERAVEIVASHKQEHAKMANRDLKAHFSSKYFPGSYFVGAAIKGKLVGLMGLYNDPDVDVKNICWAVWLYVDPKYRNQGVGKALHQAIIKEATRRKARKLYLDVGNETDHIAAVNMYKKAGYVLEGKMTDYFEEGEEKLIFSLRLGGKKTIESNGVKLPPGMPTASTNITSAAAVNKKWKIKDGAFLISFKDEVKFMDLITGTCTLVEKKHIKPLITIAMRLNDDALSHETSEYLQGKDYIQEADIINDTFIAARLREIDNSFRWLLDDEAQEIHEFAIFLHSLRKEISFTYSQGPCLPETSVRRALALYRRHSKGKILLLGDDDLVSPLLAKMRADVTVVDSHKNLLEFLEFVNHQYNLNIKTLWHDITVSLPGGLNNCFDAVFADPASSKTWFSIFLERAARAVNQEGFIYITAYLRMEGLLRHLLTQFGLVEKEVWNGFCHYYNEFYQYSPSFDSNVFVIKLSGTTNFSTIDCYAHHKDESKMNSRELDMEYCYDFYECNSWESPEKYFRYIVFELGKLFQNRIKTNTKLSRGNIFEAYFSSSEMCAHLLGYTKKKYVSLTMRVPLGTNAHERIVPLFIELFKPSSYLVAEIPRYIEYP